MTDYKCLEALTEKYKNHIDDESYVYKMCRDCKNYTLTVIVIMQKLEDTKTNENRDDVIDRAHAKFRANKLKVIEIVNINNSNDTKKYVHNRYDEIITKYEVGQIVLPDKYDENIHEMCSEGIHYFKTLETAFFYRSVPLGYRGYWIDWYENGQKASAGNYLNNKRTGLWTEWYEYKIEQKNSEGQYDADGKRTGLWTEWHYNGQKMSEGTYVDDKRTGRWIEWNKNGKIIFDCHGYDNDFEKYMHIIYAHRGFLFVFGIVLGAIIIGSKFIIN